MNWEKPAEEEEEETLTMAVINSSTCTEHIQICFGMIGIVTVIFIQVALQSKLIYKGPSSRTFTIDKELTELKCRIDYDILIAIESKMLRA